MGDLREAFERSVAANGQVVSGVDDAVIQSGRTLADQIDYATENLTGQDLTKALYLMPHLVNIYRELLATPAVRKDMKSTEGKGGKLGRLSSVPKPA